MSHLILTLLTLCMILIAACGSDQNDSLAEMSRSVEQTETGESADDAEEPSVSAEPETPTQSAAGSDAAEGMASPQSGECGPITDEMVSDGKTLFIGRGGCITCHASDATGSTLGPDLTDEEWINIDPDFTSIVYVIRNGIESPVKHPTPMPAMGGAKLTDDEICKLAAYVWSLK